MVLRIKDRIQLLFTNIKDSTKRFPITIVISSILFIMLIYLNEMSMGLVDPRKENIIKINMILGLGIFLSLNIKFFLESFIKGSRLNQVLAYTLGIVGLILYYFFLLKDFGAVATIRYAGILISLILVFLYLPRLKKIPNYEKYVLRVLGSFQIAAIYSFVLFSGVVIILFTIYQLFDVNIQGKVYYYIFLFVVFIFALPLFLSNIPDYHRDEIKYNYSKSLIVLLNYIIIPLITVYTIILYVYFGKILLTREWPKGLVSHLVLWYSVFSIGIIFIISPVMGENKIAKTFRRYFPLFVLPILLMMFLSIGQRIQQYGITENRYYVLVLGLWTTGIMVVLYLKKNLKNIIIPISLSILVLNSVIGPLSGFSLSKYSQNKRLDKLLHDYGMIDNEGIVAKPDLSIEGQIEISNIIRYFENYHSLGNIKLLPKAFAIEGMEDVFGFPYDPYSNHYNNEEYFYYSTDLYDGSIDIRGYEELINISPWDDSLLKLDDLDIIYDGDEKLVEFKKDQINIMTLDLKKLALNIYEGFRQDDMKSRTIKSHDEMSIEVENESLKLKIIFTSIGGRRDRTTELSHINNVEFILLVSRK